jgi:nucleotide-binding universal stress UspA family protein
MREGPIVVGVDDTQESLKALNKVVEVLHGDRAAGGLDLVIVFVRSTGWSGSASPAAQVEIVKALDEVELDVERDVKAALAGVNLTWRFVVRRGDPARELMSEADEQKASGIAIGGHRHSTIGAVLVHSVESRLVHIYDGTLFIVRDPAPTPAS